MVFVATLVFIFALGAILTLFNRYKRFMDRYYFVVDYLRARPMAKQYLAAALDEADRAGLTL